jgi:hypothetical protein
VKPGYAAPELQPKYIAPQLVIYNRLTLKSRGKHNTSSKRRVSSSRTKRRRMPMEGETPRRAWFSKR